MSCWRKFTGLRNRIELLAPGGDIDSIKAAILAGANAVYCGIHKFNARNRATNITFDDLNGLLRLAHSKDCQLFLTLNILILESEIPDLIRLLNRLVNTSIDGVIIQDFGLFYLLSRHFKGLNIHASTQLTTHNEGQINFLRALGASRVNLSRELSLEEIGSVSRHAHEKQMLSEVFVHGSYCISFSGLCYMSSVHGGNSGNRGRCSQPCRDPYDVTAQGKHFPLNLKDNSALTDIQDLAEAGVDSLKIEGRIKKYHYVYTVVENYKSQLQRFYEGRNMSHDKDKLYRVFNRDFSNGYLKGDIGQAMFIDNPRDNSSRHLAEKNGGVGEDAIAYAERELYAEKGEIRARLREQMDRMSTDHAPLEMTASGEEGAALKLDIVTPESAFSVSSKKHLKKGARLSLDHQEILKRFKAINETEYFIKDVEVKDLQPGLFVPFSELTAMKNRILFKLRKGQKHKIPVKLPILREGLTPALPPALSVLISSENDLEFCDQTSAEIYFQLPDAPSQGLDRLIDFFRENRHISPWFPSVLIGEDYGAALRFLREVNPKHLVSDNTGIAFEAHRTGIPWTAGPRLNLANSYSLLCLQEQFSCSGAFLSNELGKKQIRGIKRPGDFKLYYSIYHPIDVMTSRQCLFQGVSGCAKKRIDEDCLPSCHKTATLVNRDRTSFFIEKTGSNYNRIYNEKNFMNLEIVKDYSGLFSGFLIDLRNIKTNTAVKTDHTATIELFENLLQGKTDASQKIKQAIHPTTNSQYRLGI